MNQFFGRLQCLLFALMAGAGLTVLSAEQKISNITLTVSLSEQGQLALLMGDQCFAKALLPPAAFKKMEFTDQLGKGVALESDTLRIALYPGQPFVFFRMRQVPKDGARAAAETAKASAAVRRGPGMLGTLGQVLNLVDLLQLELESLRTGRELTWEELVEAYLGFPLPDHLRACDAQTVI